MTGAPTIMDLWLESARENTSLRAQLEQLEAAWLRAEADADYWYAIANNPDLEAQRHQALSDTSCVDIRTARGQQETSVTPISGSGHARESAA